MSALRKVLVVDDDAIVGKSFDRVLSKRGYVVTTAQNAHEALKQIREQAFDVVFTDIKMPGMDGVELAERVKASQPWTPVVIITGYGSTANEERAKAAGVSDFMRKPLSPEMIEESALNAIRAPTPVILAATPISEVEKATVEEIEEGSRIKNIALFLAAPFIGLAYALMLPLVGLGMLAWTGWKALVAIPEARKTLNDIKKVVLLLGTPFIGLAYAVMLPFVGIAMLLWVGGKALVATKATA